MRRVGMGAGAPTGYRRRRMPTRHELSRQWGMTSFVPDDFVPPAGRDHPAFRLRPLGPEHNESDYAAWSSSQQHIRSTPGWQGLSWPREMTPEENLADLQRHSADFAARTGFTYTVLAAGVGSPEVIGCVYIYPSETPGYDAKVASWVRVEDAGLDAVLYRAVRDWLREAWPFRRIEYASRAGA